MVSLLQIGLQGWHKEGIRKLAKKRNLPVTKFTTLALNFFILNYSGKYDRDTLDRIEFEARKKIEAQK